MKNVEKSANKRNKLVIGEKYVANRKDGKLLMRDNAERDEK